MQTLVQTPSFNLNQSISFYKKLGFKMVIDKPIVLSDGKFFVEINPNHYARAGVKMIKDSWSYELQQLKGQPKFSIENGFLIRDNNGVWVYLLEEKNWDLPIVKEQPDSHLGKFMGISIETTSFEESIAFWDKLGFVQVSGTIEQGWIVLANSDGFAISFMLPLSCPHSFVNPSLTFFNGGNNLENIKKIKEARIEVKEEITVFSNDGSVDNIIIEDPGGFAMFVFND